MPRELPRDAILVVGPSAEARRTLEAALPRGARARSLSPDLLARTPLAVDAPAAVLMLAKGAGEEDVAALAPLTRIAAGRALILLTEDVDEELLEHAIEALGPRIVLPYPVSPPALRLALRRFVPGARRGEGARRQHRPARALLGVSAAIRDLLEQVKQVAPTSMPVLIRGETGTGKELVARAIHDQSRRADRPFVAINCGALPDTLLEGELFGYKRGAFTGAERDRPGLFEQANGGTLFLDEIGDTSPALQAKLLRALESQEIRPLGSTEVRIVDARVVSATHRDVEAMVEEGSFRQDLFYRINTATLHLPPLRRRRVDIPFLAQHFAEEFGESHARRIVLDEAFIDVLSRLDFPGNVRELRNAVERAIALTAPGEAVTAKQLQAPSAPASAAPELRPGTLRARIEQVELEMIREALARFGGNRTRAAEALGLSRLGLRQKMRRLGLEAPKSKS